MRIGTERLIRALIGAGMVIGHEVGRDMTASRASRGAGIGCGAVAPVRGPLAARAIHAFVVAVAVHQLLATKAAAAAKRSILIMMCFPVMRRGVGINGQRGGGFRSSGRDRKIV